MSYEEDKKNMQDTFRRMQALFDYIDRRDDFHGTQVNQEKQNRYIQLCLLAKIFAYRHIGSTSDAPYVTYYPPTQTAPSGSVIIERELSDSVDLGFCTPEDMDVLKEMLELSDEMIPISELIDEKNRLQRVSLMFVIDGIVEK